MIKELTTPNLDALDQIIENWVITTEDKPYLNKEVIFVQEMVKILRARVVAETPEKPTVEAPKPSKWTFWRKDQ